MNFEPCSGLVNISAIILSVCKLFVGSVQTAYEHALRDDDQYVISEIKAYRGDPLTRNDNTLTWIPWNKNFCRSHSELYPLIFILTLTQIKNFKSSPITTVSPNDLVYVDLRSYGSTWYCGAMQPFRPTKPMILYG